MAITQEAELQFTTVDGHGVEASHLEYIKVDPAITVTQLTALYNGQGAIYDGVTDGMITKGMIRLVYGTPTGAKDAPVSGSNVEFTGVFNFLNSATVRKFGEAVPALAAAVLSGDKIDLGNAAVQAFIDALTTPETLYEFTNAATQVLTSLSDAFWSFRKRRKQATRVSYEVA